MKNLTCGIYYSPNNKENDLEKINYICADKKIHIRFRDFSEKEIISGFEKKLTYLLSYLMNFSYLPKVVDKYDSQVLITDFLKTTDVMTIYNEIKLYTHIDNIKGFKLTKNYKKKVCKAFGEVNPYAFPLNIQDTVVKTGNLNSFLTNFKINLIDYLFNDNYVIIIHEARTAKLSKFKRKQIRKEEKKNKNYNLVELW